MAEYIEREAAINAVFGAMADGRAIFPALNNLPAADVRPVVRGEWEEDCAGAAICSVCGEYAFETSRHHLCGWFPNFCPNCGADMRGEQDG